MPTLNDAAAAISDLIAATWPEVGTIDEVETLDAIPWSTLSPPYAAFMCSEPQASEEWGWEPIWFTVAVTVWYVAEAGQPSERRALRQKANDLQVALIPDTLATGQVLDTVSIDCSDKSAINEAFVSKEYVHRGATVGFTLLVCLNGLPG